MRLHLLSGVTGTGKTAYALSVPNAVIHSRRASMLEYARKIKFTTANTNFANNNYVDPDSWVQLNRYCRDNFSDFLPLSLLLQKRDLNEAINTGKDFVLDSPNLSPMGRINAAKEAQTYGFSTVVHEFIVPKNVAIERVFASCGCPIRARRLYRLQVNTWKRVFLAEYRIARYEAINIHITPETRRLDSDSN